MKAGVLLFVGIYSFTLIGYSIVDISHEMTHGLSGLSIFHHHEEHHHHTHIHKDSRHVHHHSHTLNDHEDVAKILSTQQKNDADPSAEKIVINLFAYFQKEALGFLRPHSSVLTFTWRKQLFTSIQPEPPSPPPCV